MTPEVRNNAQGAVQSTDDSHGFPGLPLDDKGQPGRDASAVELIPGSSATDFVNAVVQDSSLVLTSTVDESAWGLYKVEGLQGRKIESVGVQGLMAEAGQSFSVGISNYSDGVWDFLMSGTEGEFEYDLTAEQSRLSSQLGNLFIVVVVDGGSSLDLQQLSVDSRALEQGEELRPAKGGRISVSEGLADKIVIQWQSIDGALSYELWREADLAGQDEELLLLATLEAVPDQSSYSYEDTDIILDTEYKYSVRAINGLGNGSFSHRESGWAGTIGPENGGESEIENEGKGLIEAISEGSLTVDGTEYLTDASTIWLGNDKELLSSADFSVGQTVEVKGERFGLDQWVARTVELDDNGGEGTETKFPGLIEAISETSITVAGTTAAVTEATLWFDGNKAPALPADFSIGMNVELEALEDGLGGWLATKVSMENEIETGGTELRVRGVIDEVLADSITVDGVTVSVDLTTQWEDLNKDAALPADFNIGMDVQLEALSDGLGGWIASLVGMEDWGTDPHEFGISGTIDSLDGTGIVIAGFSFNVTVDTAWLDLNGDPLTIDDFSVGLLVDLNSEADGLGGWNTLDVQLAN